MTGEITLRGRILPIGGVKEKVLAAHRAGIKTFILPKRNMKDLEDVPREVLRELTFVPVERMDDVIQVALHPVPHPTGEEIIHGTGRPTERRLRKTATRQTQSIAPLQVNGKNGAAGQTTHLQTG